MIYQLTHDAEGIKVGIWAARVSPPLGFRAVIVHGLIFKGIFFFYSMDEKLEPSVELIMTVLQILKESVTIMHMDSLQKMQN